MVINTGGIIMGSFKAAVVASTAVVVALAGGSASAADVAVRSVVKGPIVAAPSQWDGFYAGVSAGGSFLKADDNRFSNAPSTSIRTATGLLDGIGTTTRNDVTNQFLTGSEKGAVFTFAMGYNFV